MSQDSIKFKKDNININFKEMSLNELNKLPLHTGILDFKITKTTFKILNILNDDSSAVKFFWKDKHDLFSLDLWYEISNEAGVYIDVGAHTGLYTLTSLKSNSLNKVIAIEPLYVNLARLLTNLRLNNLHRQVSAHLLAVSNFDGMSKFKNIEENSYLSKGGKIDANGTPIQTIKLDTLQIPNDMHVKAIKIDTEGEDFKILEGSRKIFSKYKPKVIIEVRNENKQDIQNFFDEFNYNLFAINEKRLPIDLNKTDIQNIINVYAEPK